MKKMLSLFLLSFLTWLISCGESLSASNPVIFTDLDQSKVVETIIKPEPTITENVEVQPTPTATISYAPAPATLVSAPIRTNYIEIIGRSLNIVNVSNPAENSGDHVNKVGKLYYGHNSRAVFGNLIYTHPGETFKITENGVTSTYRISRVDIYEKNAHLL
ncbi:MAG: hypothetical protein Q4B65_02755, partial [Candidatus Saccharibacteria bacterium]|nr:hypothetical protein [Candidatus Saccharibacteria bacterium]